MAEWSGPEGLGRLEQAPQLRCKLENRVHARPARKQAAAALPPPSDLTLPVIVTRMGGKPVKAGSVEIGEVRA